MTKKRSDLLQEILNASSLIQRSVHGRLHGSNIKQGLSPAQFRLLFITRHLQPVSFKTMAFKLHLTPGAVSQLVDPMMKAGYIKRTQDTKDRRVAYISLTDKGSKKIDKITLAYKSVLSEAVSILDMEELVTLNKIQQKMLNYLEQNADIEYKHKLGKHKDGTK